jgi:hypothetical protein
MPTIRYLDQNNVTHNMTAYFSAKEAEADLFPWQYVCSRLFKVSDAAPTEFRFIGELKTDDTIQGNLYDEYNKRKDNPININAFTISKAMQPISEKQMVPGIFEKDYLMLDLLLAQKVIKEKGQEHVSEYGKKLINFVESLEGKEFKEVEINAELVSEIIETEQTLISNHDIKIRKTEHLIKSAEERVKSLQSEIELFERRKQEAEKDSKYISSHEDFSPDHIASVKRMREIKRNSMGIVDKLKLQVFEYLGRNTSHFYNDGLEKLEQKLQDKIAEKAKKFNDISLVIDNTKEVLSKELEENKLKSEELKQTLQSLKAIEMLSLGKEYLDDNYIRDVSRITKESNNIFLHSISTDKGFQPYDNSPLEKGVTFTDKVNQIRCFSPSLSCSSFKLDSGSQLKDFTAPMGVVITGGHVLSANSCDAGTIPNKNGEREKRDLTPEKIKTIIDGRVDTTLYDEFAISQTKVAALYVNYDRVQREEHYNFGHFLKSVFDYQEKHPEMPVLIIKDGNFHRISPNEDFKKVFDELESRKEEARKKSYFSSDDLKALNKEFLERGLFVSEKKSLEDINRPDVELSDEQKLKIGETLIKNYKPGYQQMIVEKVNNFKNNLANLRDKFSDNSERTKLKMG